MIQVPEKGALFMRPKSGCVKTNITIFIKGKLMLAPHFLKEARGEIFKWSSRLRTEKNGETDRNQVVTCLGICTLKEN